MLIRFDSSFVVLFLVVLKVEGLLSLSWFAIFAYPFYASLCISAYNYLLKCLDLVIKTPNMKKKTYTKPEVNKIGKGSNLMVQFFTKKDKGNGKV